MLPLALMGVAATGIHSTHEPTRIYWRNRFGVPLDAPIMKIDPRLGSVRYHAWVAREQQDIPERKTSILPDDKHRDEAWWHWSRAVEGGLVIC